MLQSRKESDMSPEYAARGLFLLVQILTAQSKDDEAEKTREEVEDLADPMLKEHDPDLYECLKRGDFDNHMVIYDHMVNWDAGHSTIGQLQQQRKPTDRAVIKSN